MPLIVIAISPYLSPQISNPLQFTEEQIIALAPDESSKKAGKDLASPSKWVTKGADDQSLWGECQGSGSKPYQTQVDLSNIAFKCSCPSRKFPCKHGLGLMLFYVKQPQAFAVNEAPAWVTEWISKRADKEEKASEKKDKPVDESAQAKRLQARNQKVQDGIEELLLWIKDIIRNGILNLPEKSASFWDNMVKRMIDSQAPGLAGMIRELAGINFYKEGWQTKFIDQFVKVYLLIKAYKNIETLQEDLQADVKNLIGFTQNQEQLKNGEGITDDWFVIAKQVSTEEQLTVERYWLQGIRTKQQALILQFFVRNQLPSFTLTPGTVTNAELVFYPAAVPLRALIKTQTATKTTLPLDAIGSWKEVVEKETTYNALNPFIHSYPFIVDALKPVLLNKEWWLQDKDMALMRIDSSFQNIWQLLSICGGTALTMAVTGKENNYLPVGTWHEGRYKLL